MGLAAGKRSGGPIQGEVSEAHVVEEFKAFFDLREDVAQNQALSFGGLQVIQLVNKFRRRASK